MGAEVLLVGCSGCKGAEDALLDAGQWSCSLESENLKRCTRWGMAHCWAPQPHSLVQPGMAQHGLMQPAEG